MASSFLGGPASIQGRSIPTDNNGRDEQVTIPSALPTNSGHMPSSHTYYYPNGIPEGYKMAPAKEGETPRRYVEDNLPVSFYNRPGKMLKAIFSTNNGEFPTRGLTHVLSARELDMWSAEELQESANAIRKKHWSSLKSMPQPECWEDLYDYFDCFDIYFQGAQNLWNLIFLLFNENQSLAGDSIGETAVQVGIWCDEWVAKAKNKKKLMAFNSWETGVFDLFTSGDRHELQKMEPFNMELVRSALFHRQSQLSGKPWARPTVYPVNSLRAHREQNTLHCWLAGQPVHDTPSGIPPAVTLPTIIPGSPGSPSSQSSVTGVSGATAASHMPVNTGTTPKKPMVVSGTTNKKKAGQKNCGVASGLSSANPSGKTFSDNQEIISKPATSTSPASTSLTILTGRAPAPQVTNSGSTRPGFYSHSMGPYVHPFNTPLMTGSNGEPQPYLGPVGPLAPPAPSVPEHQHHTYPPQANMASQEFANSCFSRDGSTMQIQSSMASIGGTRVQSAAYQRSPSVVTPSYRHSGKRNVTTKPTLDQAVGRGSSMDPLRFDSGQRVWHEQFRAPNAPSGSGHDQSRLRSLSKGWEKVPHADESIHGPVFRRSPTKENRFRSFSLASTTADSNCLNQHLKTGNRYVYTPCDCNHCEERNRSLYVQLNPAPQMPLDLLYEKLRVAMSRWGEVENIRPLKGETSGNFVCFFIRFKDGSRLKEAAATDDFDNGELGCIVRIGAIHHSDYGNAMYGNSVPQDNRLHGSSKQYNSSQQSAWTGPSTGPGQAQYLYTHRDSKAQASLEEYMVPRARPPQVAVAEPVHRIAAHGSSAPLHENTHRKLPQEATGRANDTKLTRNTSMVQTKPSVTDVPQLSAETEPQSKLPSEEVIRDEEQTRKPSSPHDTRTSAGKCDKKAIVVNLPTTPQKPKKAGTSTKTYNETITPPNEVVFTPQDSETFSSPTRKAPHAPTATNRKEPPSLEGQNESQTRNENAPLVVSITKESDSALEQPPSETLLCNNGKYRKVFPQKDDLSVEIFDAPVPKIGGRNNQPTTGSPSAEQRSTEHDDDLRTRAGHELDNLLDSGRTQEEASTITLAETSTKKSNKKSKKKKKLISANQGESNSEQRSDIDIRMNAAEQHTPQASVPPVTETVGDNEPATLREVIAKAKRIVGTKGAVPSSAKQPAADTSTNAVPAGSVPFSTGTAEDNEPATLLQAIAKAKRIVGIKGAVSSSAKQPTADTLTNPAPQGSVPSTTEMADNTKPGTLKGHEPEQSPEKSDVPESANKNFRANGGGSLRLHKNRKKQPAQLYLDGREPSVFRSTASADSLEVSRGFESGLPSAASTAQVSFTTDQEGCFTDESPGMLSTPATPPPAKAATATSRTSPKRPAVGIETTSKSNSPLNPKAKEFVSPSARPAPAPTKLAPVPLKPTKHQRKVSQNSSETSRTLTPGTSPTKEEGNRSDGNAAETSKGKGQSFATQQALAKNKDAESLTAADKAQGAVQHIVVAGLAEKTKNCSLADDDVPVGQSTPGDDGDWQVQHLKKDFSTKQPKSSGQQKSHQQRQNKKGQQSPEKNRVSPKKQKIQGQSQLQQQRYASSPSIIPDSVGGKAEFPSLPAAPKFVSGLPASSVWGKARSVSAGTASLSDNTTAVKGETFGNSRPKEGSGKQ